MKKIIGILLFLSMALSACTTAQVNSTPIVTDQQQPTEEIVVPIEAKPDPTEAVEPTQVEDEFMSLTRAMTAEPKSLDPHGGISSGQNVVLPLILDTLVYRDSTNQYHPYLAESWLELEDGKVYEFKLKPGILFHDGTSLDANAVKFTFERMLSSDSASMLVGALADVVEMEVVDDLTIRFRFESPSSVFLGTLSTPYAGIISPTAVEKFGDDFGQNLVGSGAYILDQWEPGVSITLNANEQYDWGPSVLTNQGAPYLDELVLLVVPDATMQLNAFQAGDVDVLFINEPSQVDLMRQDSSAAVVESSLNSLIYLGFNCQKAPFDDINVRKAIASAIDKEELVNIAVSGLGTLAFSPLISTLPGYDPELKQYELPYSEDAVKTNLETAGFTLAADGSWQKNGETLALELLTSTRAPNEALSIVIQDQLQRIGIPVTIQTLDSRAAMQASTAGEYQVMLWRYDWNDADVLNIYLSTSRIGRTNRSYYSNAELDVLLDTAMHTLDQDTRVDLYVQAQKILMEEMPWVPLYTPKDFMVIRNNVDGYIMGAMGRLILNEATIKSQ